LLAKPQKKKKKKTFPLVKNLRPLECLNTVTKSLARASANVIDGSHIRRYVRAAQGRESRDVRGVIHE